MRTEKELFELANDFDLYIALDQHYLEKPPLQKSPYHTIGDRKRLIVKLEEKGFILSKSSTPSPLQQLRDRVEKSILPIPTNPYEDGLNTAYTKVLTWIDEIQTNKQK